jgi:DNA-binding FadR family transcriptional regulator
MTSMVLEFRTAAHGRRPSGARRAIEEDSYKDSDSIISDISFHRAISGASMNRILSLFMDSLHLTMRVLAERYFMPEAKKTSQRQHQGIYEAIVHQD